MATALKYDVQLGEDGDLPVRTQHVSGIDLVLQRLGRKLRTVLGEFIGDKSVGLPYFDWLAQKPANVAAIGAALRAAIETTPGVARVTSWLGAFDTASRTLTYTCLVVTTDGDARITIAPFGTPGADNVNPSLRMVIGYSRIAPSP